MKAPRRLLASVLCVALSGLSWADLSNTAYVSYRDATGADRTGLSNTVVVTVSSPLPPPVMLGLLPFPNELTLDATLTVQLSGGPAERLDWVFTAGDPAPTGGGTPGLAPGAGSIPVTTTASSMALNQVAGLMPGAWHVTVTASNAGGTSSPAQGDFVLVGSDLDAIKVYPNPWRNDRHAGVDILFEGLTAGVTVKIFTVSGQLVQELRPNDARARWNRQTQSGDTAASGLYLYLITDANGHKRRGKLAIMR